MRQLKFYLNFGLAIAEINIMKSNMQYVILILFIFALQMIFYTNFRQFEASFAVDQTTLNFYKKQNESLKVQLASLESQSLRLPASLSSELSQKRGEPIDMSDFYFSKAQDLYKKNQINEALKVLEKVIQNSFIVENLAKARYLKIEYKCKSDIDDSCLSDIDYLVTQHPESTWTGLSLQTLSRYYEKKQQFAESQSLKKIIKKNFSLSPSKPHLNNENIKL